MRGDFGDGPFFVIWVICVVPALLEWLVYVARPALLLPLTRLPLGVERTFQLPDEARVAPSPESTPGYRQPAMQAPAPRDLPWPTSIQTTRGVGGTTGSAAWVRLTYEWLRRRPLAVARIDAKVDVDRVRLTSTWSPFPLSSSILVVPAILVLTILGRFPSEMLFFVFIVFPAVGAINGLWARNDLRGQVEEAMNQIEGRFARPESWTP